MKRTRKETEEGRRRDAGTERHGNNTYAGQEKSRSASLAQKSSYGCNFRYFFLNVLPPPSSSLILTSLHSVHVKVENSSKFFHPALR